MIKAVVLLLLPLAADALRFSEAKKKKPMLKDKALEKSDKPEALKDKAFERSEGAGALKDKALEGTEMEYELACTAEARQVARKHIEARNWADLKEDVCVKGYAEEVERLESGKGDVEDIGEWLDGDLKVPAELRAHKQEKKEGHSICQKLPKLLYIGMGHSGSTTLSAQLNSHPDLSFGQMKEHRFHFDKGSTERNIGMYKKAFQMDCDKTAFDGSIGYIFYTPERIRAVRAALGPDAKFLLMMRDPAKWMNSLYHDGGDGLSKGHNGCYADFLEEWLKHYPRENFLIEASEDYFKDPQATIDRITKHVGVRTYKYPEKAFSHAAGRRRSGAMAQAKIAEYKADPHNIECARRLQILSNRTFPWAQEMIKAAKEGRKLQK